MSSWKKLKLLLWKNFLLQKRHKWQTFFEIISPVVFAMFLILIRCLVAPKYRASHIYKPFTPTFFDLNSPGLSNISETITNDGTVAFSPEGKLPREVAQNAIARVAVDNFGGLLALFFKDKFPHPTGFKNAEELEKACTKHNAMKKILVGVCFDDNMANATAWPDKIRVVIRFPAVMRTPMMEHPLRASWRTNLLFPLMPKGGPREPDDNYGGRKPGYSNELFLAVQHAVSMEIIKQKTGKPVDTKIFLQRFPHLPFKEDVLLVAMERFVSMIIMVCFAYTFVNTVKVITAEKELQLKEAMTILGVSPWMHWLAWFVKQMSYLTFSVVMITILFKIPFRQTETKYYSVLTFTPWSVLFFFLMLFVMASIAFCFMVSVLFSQANTAASFMGLAWFATYSVYMLTQVIYEEMQLNTKLWLCLISNTAIGYAFQMLVMCEGTEHGLQWDQFFSQLNYHESFKPWHVTAMLLLDTCLYTGIAMYIERVRPGRFGVPLPWYFPFTKQFWFPKRKKNQVTSINLKEHDNALLSVVHDDEPVGVPIGVEVKNLTKVYGKKVAVNNLNIRMFENEITVLLGHNGAGKTTTISMLTGTIPPTSGRARISGYDVVSETDGARATIGMCPQHNVLFPDLTVAEHIMFYASLKGVPDDRLDEEVHTYLSMLNLLNKRDVLSARLSGGQQRRLSVGTAMCGASRVVMLDEPTSGLDPAARRHLWDLLQNAKKGRTIILTTHFMDEAEVLGDRIAIMAGGRLQCYGTSYFLKKHYGIGYKVTIVKGPVCNIDNITAFFNSYVPDVTLNSNLGAELSYILPGENVTRFPEMLKAFEEQKKALGVNSYGLSITTLEEVFMKVGAEDFDLSHFDHADNPDDFPLDGKQASAPSIPDISPYEKVSGFRLLINHVNAMFLKLAFTTMRSKLAAFIQFVSPLINISLTVLVSRSWSYINSLPPLDLTLKAGYRTTETLMSHTENLANNSDEYGIMEAYRKSYDEYYPGRTLNNINTQDIQKYYLMLSKQDGMRVRYETLVGATFAPGNVTAWFGNFGYHDSAMALAAADNAVLRARVPQADLLLVNHPLPYSVDNMVKIMASGSSIGFQFAFNIAFCMAFVTSFIVLFAIKERVSGARLLQRVSGAGPGALWCCALVWDWLWLLVLNVAIVAMLAIFQEQTLSTSVELGRIFLLLLVFAFATIPIHYLASFCFTAAPTGFSKMCFVNVFCGVMPFLITEVLKLPDFGSPEHALIFDWLFAPLPLYCLSRSFRDLSVSAFAILACDSLCDQFPAFVNCTRQTICHALNVDVCCMEGDPYFQWSEPGVGRYLFMMIVVGSAAFTILLLKEYRIFEKLKPRRDYKLPPPPVNEDQDVAAERLRVATMRREDMADYSLVCKDLTKYYKTLLAVNRLSFVVERAQCFGLLGINGAGKTSTFRMLAGDAPPSAGDALVHGHSVRTQLASVHREIGYCPQFDGLLDNLTARETMRIFCLLRGIPAAVGAARADQLARDLGFARHMDKQVKACSGGTKRKISTAVALLGDSRLIFLDEPTTGMDPASKRLVWRCVSGSVSRGRSVVLTSHSMEECEALCSRLTVMIDGHMHCLGPLQHLKNRYSQGYTLIVKMKPAEDRDAQIGYLNRHLATLFTDIQVVESYLGITTYYIKDEGLPWWQLFQTMEGVRASFPIDDYSATQTTLEQVFMMFTRLQPSALVTI